MPPRPRLRPPRPPGPGSTLGRRAAQRPSSSLGRQGDRDVRRGVRVVRDVRLDARIAVPAGPAAWRAAVGSVPVAGRSPPPGRALGELADRGRGRDLGVRGRLVPAAAPRGVPRACVGPHRARALDRLLRGGRHAAAAVLARRLLVRVLRTDRGRVSREPLRPDAARVLGRRALGLRGPEVGRHAGGLRAALDDDLGGDREGVQQPGGPGGRLPGDRGRGRARDPARDRRHGPPRLARADGLRDRGLRREPGRAVPRGLERPQRPGRGARGGDGVRAARPRAGAARDRGPRAGSAREGHRCSSR